MLEGGDPPGFFSSCADYHTKWNKSFPQREVSGAGSIITEMGTPLLEMWVQKGEERRRIRKSKKESDGSELYGCLRCDGETCFSVQGTFANKNACQLLQKWSSCSYSKKSDLNINWGARADQGQGEVFRSGPLSMWTTVSTTCRILHKDVVLRLLLKRPYRPLEDANSPFQSLSW